MEEIWKRYNDKYEASSYGNVRHIRHKKILKYSYPGNGTPQVGTGQKTLCVSHIVASPQGCFIMAMVVRIK
jgi:hypothetical protein